jgi:hypothetical protein
MTDISCLGARLSGNELPMNGEALELTVEGVRAFGTVAWLNECECGIAFDDPLEPLEVERLRRIAGIPSLAKLSIEQRVALERWLLSEPR